MYFYSSRRRHTRWPRDWSSDVCSSDLVSLSDFTIYLREDRSKGNQTTLLEPLFTLDHLSYNRRRSNVSFAKKYWHIFTQAQIGRASCRERVKNTMVDEIFKANVQNHRE